MFANFTTQTTVISRFIFRFNQLLGHSLYSKFILNHLSKINAIYFSEFDYE